MNRSGLTRNGIGLESAKAVLAIFVVLSASVRAATVTAPPPGRLSGQDLSTWLAGGAVRSGDVVELGCGMTWHEHVLVPLSLKNLTIRAASQCAEGERPTIRPTRILAGWRDEGDGLFSVEFELPVKQVFSDGAWLPVARFPVSGYLALQADYVPMEVGGQRFSGSLPFHLTAELRRKAWAGAGAHVRGTGYFIDAGTIQVVGSGDLVVVGWRNPAPRGARMAFSGKAWMLESARSSGWAWEERERRLFVRLPDGRPPMLSKVEASVAGAAIDAKAAIGLSLSGFAVFGAGDDGISCEACRNLGVTDVQVAQAGRDGLHLLHAKDVTLSQVRVKHSGRDGVALGFTERVSLKNSQISDTGTAGWPQSSGAAVNGSYSRDLLIEGNVVERSGYIGVRLHRRATVRQNQVLDSCLALDDCGAIYSWADDDPEPLNSVISDNLVRGVPGGRDGSPNDWTLAAGIYLDDLSADVKVVRNAVLQAERGIMLHNVVRAEVTGNLVTQVRSSALAIDHGHPRVRADSLERSVIRQNVLASDGRGQSTVFVLDRAGRTIRDRFEGNTLLSRSGGKWLRTQYMGRSSSLMPSPEVVPFDLLDNQVARGEAHLFEPAAAARRHACPWKSTRACAEARDESGSPVVWPMEQSPGVTRWVYRTGSP